MERREQIVKRNSKLLFFTLNGRDCTCKYCWSKRGIYDRTLELYFEEGLILDHGKLITIGTVLECFELSGRIGNYSPRRLETLCAKNVCDNFDRYDNNDKLKLRAREIMKTEYFANISKIDNFATKTFPFILLQHVGTSVSRHLSLCPIVEGVYVTDFCRDNGEIYTFSTGEGLHGKRRRISLQLHQL